LGGVVLAAAVALVLTVIPIPMPPATSLEMALSEANSVLSFHFWAPIIAAVLILSVRRQGIDVLLLRAVVVEFIYGATFLSLIVGALVSIHIPITPRVPWPVVVVAGALIWAVAIGLFVGVVAALANVLWFRTFNTLRPQLRLRRRG
jgi:hypothetical protein